MGWNEHEMGANLESFEMERSGFLRKVQRSTPALQAAAD
jgi:hypothetical protein